MMWKEFEELAGYEVSYEDYSNVIEPMYMALPAQYSKQDFIKMIDKKRFALKTRKQLVKEMKELAEQIREVAVMIFTCSEGASLESIQNNLDSVMEKVESYERSYEEEQHSYYEEIEYVAYTE